MDIQKNSFRNSERTGRKKERKQGDWKIKNEIRKITKKKKNRKNAKSKLALTRMITKN